MAQVFPPLEISQHWQSVNDSLLRIVELIPEERLNWTPQADLWNSRGVLIHISDARDGWLANTVVDGDPYPNIWTTARSRDDLRRELMRSFARLQRFLSNQAQLDASYRDDWNGETVTLSGHWIAFHLLEHDIHHRAELLQRIALMGIGHDIDV